MNKTLIDIGGFRAVMAASKDKAAPAVRFATVGDAVASTEDRTFTFVFSDESVDRYGDVIYARGWDLANFNANPIALFGHDANTVENVIGKAKNVRVEGSRLIGDIEFMGAEVNPNAEAVYQMVKGGFLKTVSVGFQPIEWELSFASKWLVSRFLKIVVEAVQEYEKSLMGLGQTYGEISPQNPDAFTVKPENLTTFNTELKKLQAIEVELALLPLPVKVIEQAPLTPFDLNVLEAFIDLGSMTTPRDPKSSLVPV